MIPVAGGFGSGGSYAGNVDTITAAFNHQVYLNDRMDVQHMQLYDTITGAAASSVNQNTFNFFSNVGPQSGKTIALTNLAQPRQLQAPQAFSIFAFRLRWAETVLKADLDSILAGFDFEFYIGGKVYQQAPLWIFGAGGGEWGFSDVSSTSVYTNGMPTRESMHRLAIPIVIDNVASFYAQLNGTPYTLTASASGGTGFTAQLVLDGFYARGVQ